MYIRSLNVDSNNGNVGFNNTESNKIRSNQKDVKGAIFAGDLNLGQDKVALNKELAHKKALKVITDSFGKEMEIDNNQEQRRQHISDLEETIKNTREEKNKITGLQNELAGKFNISEDSEEQKDLDLLRKERELLKTGKIDQLTEEEKTRLEAMKPMTDYQKTALEYDDMADTMQGEIEAAERGIQAETATINAVNLARLKVAPMLDARKESDAILEASSKEIIGMLISDAVQHVDEELEKAAEIVKEEKEKEAEKAKEEEAIEEREATNSGEGTETKSFQVVLNQDKLQHDLKVLIEIQQVLEEDLKGILLDQKL